MSKIKASFFSLVCTLTAVLLSCDSAYANPKKNCEKARGTYDDGSAKCVCEFENGLTVIEFDPLQLRCPHLSKTLNRSAAAHFQKHIKYWEIFHEELKLRAQKESKFYRKLQNTLDQIKKEQKTNEIGAEMNANPPPFLPELATFNRALDWMKKKDSEQYFQLADWLFNKVNAMELPECTHLEKENKIKEQGRLLRDSSPNIYKGCLGNDCDIVIKRIPLHSGPSIANFGVEVNLLELLSENEVSPPIKMAYICREKGKLLGKIILEKIGESLSSYLNKNRKENLTQDELQDLFDLVSKMHEKGVVHQNLTTSHILIKKTTSSKKAIFYITNLKYASQYTTGDPKETSRRDDDFISGTKSEQMKHDFLSLIHSLNRLSRQVTGNFSSPLIFKAKSINKHIGIEFDE